MLLGPNKKAAQMIVASMKKDGDHVQKLGEEGEGPEMLSDEMMEEDGDVAVAKEAAAQKVMMAIESKDAKALAMAVQMLVDLCS